VNSRLFPASSAHRENHEGFKTQKYAPQKRREILQKVHYKTRCQHVCFAVRMFATHAKQGCMTSTLRDNSWRRKCSFAHGITPLYVASHAGHTDTVLILLAAGAYVDATNMFDGATALDAASRRGHASVVSALLDYGAKSHVQRKNGGMTAERTS